MNDRQREVQLSMLQDEQEYIRILKETYRQASQDCENKIRELSARTDLENIQSIVYQQQYQMTIKKQIDEALMNLQNNEYSSMNDYLENCYTNSFTGTLYDLHGQGVPVLFPIDQSQVAKAVQLDSAISVGLYTRLGEDVLKLKDNIRSQVSRGIASGSTWNQTATEIAMGMRSPFNKAYNNAVRIARTEGHRIQNQAQADTLKKAKSKGADVVKQWDSTLDDVTRDTHKQLDGQIRECDEPFEVNGKTAMQPGGFGDPAEDCNCRCCMLQRAKWALDESELRELESRAEYFGLDKAESFEDFKKKYLNASKNSGIIEPNLTHAENAALNAYISSDSYKINEKLRSDVQLTEDEKRIVDNLDKALQKMPKYEGTVYRSLDSSVMENPAEFWRLHQPGSVVQYSAFTSTSLRVYDENMDIQCVITSKTGRNITSFNKEEEEILFGKDTNFIITEVIGNTIFMEEV